jgi:hypothetical protein
MACVLAPEGRCLRCWVDLYDAGLLGNGENLVQAGPFEHVREVGYALESCPGLFGKGLADDKLDGRGRLEIWVVSSAG